MGVKYREQIIIPAPFLSAISLLNVPSSSLCRFGWMTFCYMLSPNIISYIFTFPLFGKGLDININLYLQHIFEKHQRGISSLMGRARSRARRLCSDLYQHVCVDDNILLSVQQHKIVDVLKCSEEFVKINVTLFGATCLHVSRIFRRIYHRIFSVIFAFHELKRLVDNCILTMYPMTKNHATIQYCQRLLGVGSS